VDGYWLAELGPMFYTVKESLKTRHVCQFFCRFLNIEKTMEHSDHWIMTGWHGEQWDFQNNEKTMEHSDRWIMTGWHGEQ
jgi:hypothetical protein